jgi:hypothetical protein
MRLPGPRLCDTADKIPSSSARSPLPRKPAISPSATSESASAKTQATPKTLLRAFAILACFSRFVGTPGIASLPVN